MLLQVVTFFFFKLQITIPDNISLQILVPFQAFFFANFYNVLSTTHLGLFQNFVIFGSGQIVPNLQVIFWVGVVGWPG